MHWWRSELIRIGSFAIINLRANLYKNLYLFSSLLMFPAFFKFFRNNLSKFAAQFFFWLISYIFFLGFFIRQRIRRRVYKVSSCACRYITLNAMVMNSTLQFRFFVQACKVKIKSTSLRHWLRERGDKERRLGSNVRYHPKRRRSLQIKVVWRFKPNVWINSRLVRIQTNIYIIH